MKTAALILAAVLTLAAAGPAPADKLTDQIAAFQPIALQWWAGYGVTPGFCPQVTYGMADLGGRSGVTIIYRNGADGVVERCEVWWDVRLADQPPSVVCDVVLHETGHVLGLEHSPDPTNIMNGQTLVTPPVCQAKAKRHRHRARRHWVRRHGHAMFDWEA